MHAALDAAYEPSFLKEHPSSAFANTVKRYAIPKRYFEELISGVSADMTTFRYETFEQLARYCYGVASVVGLIMTEVFGYSDAAALPYAADLGTAMQLTNILRDIRTDLDLSRIYIPQEDLRTFDYSEEELQAHTINGNFVRLMRFEIDRARTYYARAERGIPYLTDDGSKTTVVAMSKIYSSILGQIERHNYDVFSERRFVSTARKLTLTASYMLSPAERNRYAHPRDAARHAAAHAGAAGVYSGRLHPLLMLGDLK
jgi:phytoene synthase